MSVEATPKVTAPVTAPVTVPVEAPKAPAAVTAAPVKKDETTGTVGGGVNQGTPAEGTAKKLYVMA